MAHSAVAAARFWPLDGLKAVAALLILLHHGALYGPLAQALTEVTPAPAAWLQDFGRFAVHVFLVIGGYLAAGSLRPESRSPLIRRYLRLTLPFMAAVALTLVAHVLTLRWLPELAPTDLDLGQLLAHALLLHGILDQESLTVGAWYVAIDFQLYVMLWWLMARRRPLIWIAGLALASALVFNRWSDWDNWAPYFFAAYGLGALAQRLPQLGFRGHAAFALVTLGVAAAWVIEPRGRLALALATSVALMWMPWQSLPAGSMAAVSGYLGQRAYALFLTHFPVLLLVNAGFELAGSPTAWAPMTLTLAAGLSYGTAHSFFRWIEQPAGRWTPEALVRALSSWKLLPVLSLVVGAQSLFDLV
ncbi:acyltransferase family protein [Inhella gelatinilytica]|uniref:Acyltransferase n=1 Tax=Inhella gelatinilytica TaxID=2795030 RepID=A0A931NF59_9BURK|nr:acyltransferase family protein [Inhella gelatinilytica]MBH9553925.1 acyltransferase [Inhella gelatinilytica]